MMEYSAIIPESGHHPRSPAYWRHRNTAHSLIHRESTPQVVRERAERQRRDYLR
jgi:hypothetical protein